MPIGAAASSPYTTKQLLYRALKRQTGLSSPDLYALGVAWVLRPRRAQLLELVADSLGYGTSRSANAASSSELDDRNRALRPRR